LCWSECWKRRKWRSREEEISEKYEEGIIEVEQKRKNEEMKEKGIWEEGIIRNGKNMSCVGNKLKKSVVFTWFPLRCCITTPNIDMGLKAIWRWVVGFTLWLHYRRDWMLNWPPS
jgi:hypothetical protein